MAAEGAAQCNNMDCSSSESSEGRIATVAAQHAELLQPHVLHFLLYVPPPRQRPLRLLDRSGKPLDSNSFWLPSWGGVIVINPHEVAGAATTPATRDDAELHVDAASHGDMALDAATYKRVAGIVVSQLHALLGLPLSNIPAGGISRASSSGAKQLHFLPAPVSGFALWEVEALLRQRTAADVVTASTTLASLSRLVQDLPNLEMPDLIGQQVRPRLQHAHCACAHRQQMSNGLQEWLETSAFDPVPGMMLHRTAPVMVVRHFSITWKVVQSS